MSHRRLTWESRGLVLALVATVSLVAPPASPQTDGASPRMEWGDPDLQGVWNNSTLTPFQRPESLGDKEFLTEEEAANIAQAEADRNAALARRPASRTLADPTGNVDRGVDGAPGSYNNFWMERGTAVVPTRRTSVIVLPPNGRLPAVTAQTHARMTSPEAAGVLPMSGADGFPPIPTSSSIWVTDVSGIAGSRHSPRRTTTTIRSCRIPTSSPFCRSTSTTSGSSRWMAARMFPSSSASMEEIRAATGRARRWSSRRPTSIAEPSSGISIAT